MATQEEINRLKQIQEQTGATNEEIQAKLDEKDLDDKFVEKFGTQKPEKIEEPDIALQQKTIQEQEREKLRQERIAEGEMREEPRVEPKVEPDVVTQQEPITPPAEPLEPAEPPKEEEPIIDFSKIQSVEDWKEQTGGGLSNLESWIEARYNTIATEEDGKIKANIGGVDYEWTLDEAGSPKKTQIGLEELEAKDYLKQLIDGEEFTDPTITNSTKYKLAEITYNKYNQLASLNEAQLSQALQDGSLLQGSNLYRLLSLDPEIKNKIDKATALNNINNVEVDVETSGTDKTNEVLNNPTISNFMEDNNISVEEFNTLVNTPEVVAQGNKVEEYEMKVNELQALYNDIERATEEKYKGTGATKQDIASLVARRQEDQLPALNLAIANYNTAYGIYSDMKQESIDLFELNLGLYQQQQTRQQALEDEQRQLQQQYAYTYGDLESEDPTLQNIAIERAVSDMYTRYPITGMESQSVKVQKVKDYMSGAITGTPMSATEAIAQVEQEIRTSPGYQALMTGTAEAPDVTRIGTDEEGNAIYGTYNASTGEYEPITISTTTDYEFLDFSTNTDLINTYPNEASFKNNNPTGMTWGISDNLKGLFDDAGINYGIGTARPKAEGGNYIKFDTVQDGMEAYKIALTQAGSDTVFDRLQQWVGTTNTNTNIAYAKDIMEQAGLNPGAKFSELSENALNNLMSVQLQRESPNFYNELVSPTTGGEVEITNSDIVSYNSATPSDKQKILKTEVGQAITEKRNEIFSDPESDINDILTYSQGGDTINQTSEQQLSKYLQALNQVADLTEMLSDTNTGPIVGTLRSNLPYDVKAQTIKAQLNALVPNLARGVYGEVGVLTDADIANYSKTIPNLTSTQDVNDAILGMTLKLIGNGYKDKLQSLGRAGFDVSGYVGLYKSIDSTVENLIGTPTETTSEFDTYFGTNEVSSPDTLFDKYY